MSRLPLFLLAAALATTPLAAKDNPGYSAQTRLSLLLCTEMDAAGQPLRYPVTDKPQVSAVEVVLQPGAETGWHKHPFPCFAYLLAGEITVEMEGGKTHRYTAGQAMAESVNVLHNGRNTGPEPVRLVLFVMGEEGRPYVERPKP
jgi:quercetin dioxygenase-like cupin family protein